MNETKRVEMEKKNQKQLHARKKEIVQKPNKTRQRSDKRKENDPNEKIKLLRFMCCLFCSLQCDVMCNCNIRHFTYTRCHAVPLHFQLFRCGEMYLFYLFSCPLMLSLIQQTLIHLEWEIQVESHFIWKRKMLKQSKHESVLSNRHFATQAINNICINAMCVCVRVLDCFCAAKKLALSPSILCGINILFY